MWMSNVEFVILLFVYILGKNQRLLKSLYGTPNVSKILENDTFVYLPQIYKYDSDLSEYLSNYMYGPDIIESIDSISRDGPDVTYK